jgi:hypothetical protein
MNVRSGLEAGIRCNLDGQPQLARFSHWIGVADRTNAKRLCRKVWPKPTFDALHSLQGQEPVHASSVIFRKLLYGPDPVASPGQAATGGQRGEKQQKRVARGIQAVKKSTKNR